MPAKSEAELIELLRTGSRRTRLRAAQELALVGRPTALAALRETLESKDPQLRLAAGFAMWKIARSQEGVKAALEVLLSASSDAREAAVYALGAMGSKVLPFIDELLAHDPDRKDLVRLREEIRAQ